MYQRMIALTVNIHGPLLVVPSFFRPQVDRWLVVIVSPAVAFFTLAKHIEENVMEELEVTSAATEETKA